MNSFLIKNLINHTILQFKHLTTTPYFERVQFKKVRILAEQIKAKLSTKIGTSCII